MRDLNLQPQDQKSHAVLSEPAGAPSPVPNSIFPHPPLTSLTLGLGSRTGQQEETVFRNFQYLSPQGLSSFSQLPSLKVTSSRTGYRLWVTNSALACSHSEFFAPQSLILPLCLLCGSDYESFKYFSSRPTGSEALSAEGGRESSQEEMVLLPGPLAPPSVPSVRDPSKENKKMDFQQVPGGRFLESSARTTPQWFLGCILHSKVWILAGGEVRGRELILLGFISALSSPELSRPGGGDCSLCLSSQSLQSSLYFSQPTPCPLTLPLVTNSLH